METSWRRTLLLTTLPLRSGGYLELFCTCVPSYQLFLRNFSHEVKNMHRQNLYHSFFYFTMCGMSIEGPPFTEFHENSISLVSYPHLISLAPCLPWRLCKAWPRGQWRNGKEFYRPSVRGTETKRTRSNRSSAALWTNVAWGQKNGIPVPKGSRQVQFRDGHMWSSQRTCRGHTNRTKETDCNVGDESSTTRMETILRSQNNQLNFFHSLKSTQEYSLRLLLKEKHYY